MWLSKRFNRYYEYKLQELAEDDFFGRAVTGDLEVACKTKASHQLCVTCEKNESASKTRDNKF